MTSVISTLTSASLPVALKIIGPFNAGLLIEPGWTVPNCSHLGRISRTIFPIIVALRPCWLSGRTPFSKLYVHTVFTKSVMSEFVSAPFGILERHSSCIEVEEPPWVLSIGFPSFHVP